MNTTIKPEPRRRAAPSNTTRTPLLVSVLLACMAMLIVGCSGQDVIRGRVIAGPIGQSVAAAPGDERFSERGIPAAKVTVLHKGGNEAMGRGVYTSAETDEMGNFELIFVGGSYPRDAVEIRVSGDGIFTSRSQTFLPKEGDQLLCVVITRPGYEFPEPVNPDGKQNPRGSK